MEVALIGKCTIAPTSPPYLYYYCGCGLHEIDGSEKPYLWGGVVKLKQNGALRISR